MKQLDTTSLRQNVTYSIILAMLLLIIVTVATAVLIQKHREDLRKQEYNKQVHHSIEYTIKQHLKVHIYRVRRLVGTTVMPELLKQRDREGLYRLLKPKWDLMREEESDLSIMHVHLPDGNSFLRMHKPEKFGDQLTYLRPMIEEIHHSHEMIIGYETGKYATNYRIIAPIFDADQKYIGAFEIGLSPNFVLRAIHEIKGFFGLVFIKESDPKLFSRPNDLFIEGYRLQSELTPELEAIYGVLAPLNLLEDDVEIAVGNKRYLGHLFAFNDFQNKPKVKILFFQDISEVSLLQQDSLLVWLLMSMVIILSLLIWFVYRRIGTYQDDVTGVYRKQLEQLDESENRFHLLYEKAPIAYQSMDCDGNILIVNAKWCEELGFSKEEAIGKKFSDFLVPEYRKKFAENFPNSKAAGGCSNIEFEIVRKDGERITITFNGKVIYDEAGSFLQMHCIFVNITEQKRIEEKLIENEEKFSKAFNNHPTPMQIINVKTGEKVDINNSALQLLGYTREEFQQGNICGISIWVDPQVQKKGIKKLVKDRFIYNYPIDLINTSGQIRNLLSSGVMLEIGDGNLAIVNFIDITEQKQLQNELAFNRNYLQNIFDSTPNIMIATDGKSMDKVTPAMLAFFGYETLDAFKSEHDCICEFFLEDYDLLQPVMQGVNWLEYILSRPTQLHKVHMMYNGKQHRFIVQAKPIMLDEKRRSVVTLTDVTEFEEVRERLEYAVNGTNDGLWDWDIESGVVYFSPRWKAILGYKDEELPNLFQTWKDRIHPDDIKKALHDVNMNHQSPGIPYENIYRLRHKDGHWVWILDRGQTIFDKNGKAVRMVGFHTDISEIKNLGEQLSQSRQTLLENEEKFKAIVTSTQDAIIMLDDKAQLVFWNPSAKEMLGYDEDEFAGKDFHDIAAPKAFYEAYKKGYRKFAGSGEGAALGKTLELSAIRKGGIEFPISLSLSGVQFGGRWYGIGIMRDITEQKALENELRASKQQFDLFMLHMPYFINIKDESYRSVYTNPATDKFLNKTAAGTTAIENSGEKVGQQINALCDRAKVEGKAEEIIKYEQNGQSYILRALAFAIPQNDGKVYVGVIYIDITKQYKDRHEIAKFQQVLEKSPISIVITDIDGNIEYVNPWFCQLTGYSREEVIGKNPKILLSGYTSKHEYKAMWDQIAKGNIWTGIFKNLKKNGEEYWESAIIAPIKNEKGNIVNYIGIKQEITEKVRLKEELVKQEEKTQELGTILEESLNEIYIFDRNSLKFLYANKGAQKNLGYSLEELFEMTPLDIKPQLTAEKFSELVKPLDRDDAVRIFFSTDHQRKDGTIYPVDVYLQQIVFEGIDAYMAIIIDTTEREEIRKELRDQEEIMIAQSRHAAMGEMIGMIAHQWRQPITVIAMGANNMLVDIELEEVKEENFKEQAKSILKQTEYLSNTIDDFRNFFRPDKEKEEVNIEEVMGEAEKIIGKTLEHANITLSIKDKNGYKVKTYSRELLQVFINLLKNAKEALMENRETDRHIDVMISDDADNVITTVCDNGGGISEVIIERIFDPYFSTKDEKTGTGLGLYMSKTIVEKHLHGTIEVSNTKEGACFKITIPLARRNEEEDKITSSPVEKGL